MEILNSFFRKKNTIIYYVILSMVMLSIILINAFINYYDEIININFIKNSYLLFTSEEDLANTITELDYVKNLVPALIVQPDYSYEAIKESIVIGNDGHGISTNDYSAEVKDSYYESEYIDWSKFKADETNVVIYPASYFEKSNLSNNEIILMISYGDLTKSEKEYSREIIGENLGFYLLKSDNVNSKEFVIKDFIDNEVPIIIISDELFFELQKESNLYSYRVVINDYNRIYEARDYLGTLNHHKDLNVVYISDILYGFDEAQLLKLVEGLRGIGIIAIIIISILVFIISNNILRDEMSNIYLLRLIGYNRKQILRILLIRIMLLMLLSISLALLLATPTVIIINSILEYNLIILNYLVLKNIFYIIVGGLILVLVKVILVSQRKIKYYYLESK